MGFYIDMRTRPHVWVEHIHVLAFLKIYQIEPISDIPDGSQSIYVIFSRDSQDNKDTHSVVLDKSVAGSTLTFGSTFSIVRWGACILYPRVRENLWREEPIYIASLRHIVNNTRYTYINERFLEKQRSRETHIGYSNLSATAMLVSRESTRSDALYNREL